MSPITPPINLNVFRSFSDPYTLELFVYKSYRGPHNKPLRKSLLASLGVDCGPCDVVTLYRHIRSFAGI